MRAIASATLLAVAATAAFPQPSTFEVASIRSNQTGGGRSSAEFSLGGQRFIATNISLGALIIVAYSVTPQQVAPLDPFIRDRYDVQAKADHAVSRDEMLRMLKALLADRFKLRIRRKLREIPVYALIRGKGELKLHLSAEQLPWTLTRALGAEQHVGPRIARLSFENESMTDFAAFLSTQFAVGRHVVDETGLKGNYDFELSHTPPDLPTSVPAGPEAPSIFTSVQEQLGLKLEPRRAPVEFLVIEHAEKPSEN